MPFEVFSPPKVHGSIAATIGKSSGVVMAKGLKTVTAATNKMRAKGCPNPAELAKVSAQVGGISALSGALTGQLAAFKAIPGGLKAPVGGIKSAVSTILGIAIPQAFPHVYVGPPGLPVSFTLQLYDLCNMLKEMAAAFELTADAISNTVSSSEGSIEEIARQVKVLQAPIKACKIEHKLKKNLTKDQAAKLKLLDKDGEFITSSIGSKVLEKSNTRPASEQLKVDLANKLGVNVDIKGASSIEDIIDKTKNPVAAGLKAGDAFRLLPPGTYKTDTGETKEITGKEFAVLTKENIDDNGNSELKINFEEANSLKPGGLTGAAQALAELDSALIALSDKLTIGADGVVDDLGVEREVLETLKNDLEELSEGLVTKKEEELVDPDLTYKGYLLKIIKDPASPQLAPKHYAVGIKDGKQAIKGPSSFSSSREVLLEEIKFRIDNQLS